MNFGTVLDESIRRYPDKTALIFEGAETSFTALGDQIDRFGAALLRLGIAKGDRVALLLPSNPEYVVSYFAALRIGACVVSLNFALKGRELSYILNDATPSAIITTTDLGLLATIQSILPELRSIRHVIVVSESEASGALDFRQMIARSSGGAPVVDCDRGDPAVILYTSGTTGRPKGAVLSHHNLLMGLSTGNAWYEHTSDTVFLSGGAYYAVGFGVLPVSVLFRGGTMVVQKRFRPDATLELVTRYRVSGLWAAPTMYVYLLQELAQNPGKYDLSSVRKCGAGAAPMEENLMREVESRFGAKLMNCYGATETNSIAGGSYQTWAEMVLLGRKPGSCGRAAPNHEVRIVDDNDRALGPGVVGEIVLRGPCIMKGYWNNPAATEKALHDGWYHSGDLGWMDGDGELWVVDRKIDMILCGGNNIYPAEVEDVLFKHPKILEAAVIGVPDRIMGEIPKAVVVARPGQALTADEIIGYCREQMATYKVPRLVEFRAVLPKSGPLQKVDKLALKGKREGL